MIDHRASWAAYQEAWEDIPADERERLVRASTVEAVSYRDPAGAVTGQAALAERIAASRGAMPEASFANHRFDDHHDEGAAEWTLTVEPGGDVVAGSSWARFDDEGRLVEIAGFFTPPGQEGATAGDADARRATVLEYMTTWTAIEPDHRRRLMESCLTPDCVYLDPAGTRRGHEGLAAYQEQFQRGFPGASFAVRTLETHHDDGLVGWTRLDGDGEPDIDGRSHLRFAADGRLVAMTGFPDVATFLD